MRPLFKVTPRFKKDRKKAKSLGKILTWSWNVKLWRNKGELCDRKYHVSYAPYRRYRRGSNRCSECGYKVGKSILKRESNSEVIVDNIFHENTLLKMLSEKGRINTK